MTAREVLGGIRGRLTAATPGPWYRDSAQDADGSNFTENVTARLWDVAMCPGGDTAPNDGRKYQAARDASFVAAAPTDVARMVAAVETVLGLADKWRADFPSKARDIEAAIEAALKEDPQ